MAGLNEIQRTIEKKSMQDKDVTREGPDTFEELDEAPEANKPDGRLERTRDSTSTK